MGYCMTQMEQDFKIKGENIPAAWEALKKKLNGNSIHMWVDNRAAITAPSFERTMEKCRWSVETYDTHDVEEINFEGEKLGNDDIIFKTLAPYVEPNSYIQMQGEDGYIWRWVFDGKTVVEKAGRIVFD